MDRGAWWAAVHRVTKNRIRLSKFTFTFHFHALEKEMATHSSVFAWRIPGMGEPSGLPSMGLHRVGHDWSDLAAARTLFLTPGDKYFLLKVLMFCILLLDLFIIWVNFSINSVQFSHSVMLDSLRPHGLQHARPTCPSPNPRSSSNSHPLSR